MPPWVRSLRVLGLVVLALAWASPSTSTADVGDRPVRVAAAKPKAKAKAKPKPKAKKPKGKRKPAKRKPANMPPGWHWPPTKAMQRHGKQCLAQLDALGVTWKKAKRIGRIVTPIQVPSMQLGGVKLVPTFRKPPFTMDCHLALGLAQHLPRLAAAGVVEARFSRIYGNTRVRAHGRTGSARSRHMLGLAIDIRSFVAADGTTSVVLDDYPLGNELLLTIEQQLNDSGGFRTLLTPSNDPQSHDDHYHLEVNVAYPKR